MPQRVSGPFLNGPGMAAVPPRGITCLTGATLQEDDPAGVIRSFGDRAAEQLYKNRASVRFQAIAKVALRKLDALDAATDLWRDLGLPGNHLEKLKGDRAGQHSIKVNDQWRVCFRWKNEDAHDVEIVDYH
ncbi:MAG: type II toxin-antitoxin system RelE/ParE family toxin [Candidatus Binataceae bacterium]